MPECTIFPVSWQAGVLSLPRWGKLVPWHVLHAGRGRLGQGGCTDTRYLQSITQILHDVHNSVSRNLKGDEGWKRER